MKLSKVTAFVAAASLLLGGFFADASHSWGNYHWARTANPFTLKLGDNVTAAWDGHLGAASADWSVSAVLDTEVTAGAASPKNCRPKAGRVEVCNARYGKTNWLGVASIWASGSHITQGTVKLNDTYFNAATYNTPAWRQSVMCQEIGHTFGLDHQDENFDNPNLGTCMDYTRDPSTNQRPNQHDYDQLATIYAHLDSTTTLSSAAKGAAGAAVKGSDEDGGEIGDDPATWGKVVKRSTDGKSSLHEKDLKGGSKVFTFVIWAK